MRITILIDLQENFPQLIRISIQGQTSHTGIVMRTMEDHMINAQISHSAEAMEVDLGMDFSAITMGPGETTETSLVLHRFKGELSHKIVHAASQRVISLTILPSADLIPDLQFVLHLGNKSSHKAITTRHLIWFVSLQPKKPLMNYQTSVR